MGAPSETSRKWLVRSLLIVAVVVLFWCFPLFHVLPQKEARQKRDAEAFDAETYAAEFLNERLPQEYDKAVDADTLIAAIRKDPDAAKSQYAVTLAEKSDYYYFVRGRGHVVGVEDEFVALSLDGEGSTPAVHVTTGPIFNNALRDGTGLIDPSNFDNQVDFNGISAALNRLVEDRVLPPFREAVSVGDTVQFVGCAEIAVEATDLDPIAIVPIELKVR